MTYHRGGTSQCWQFTELGGAVAWARSSCTLHSMLWRQSTHALPCSSGPTTLRRSDCTVGSVFGFTDACLATIATAERGSYAFDGRNEHCAFGAAT